jgi:hypothetical protein
MTSIDTHGKIRELLDAVLSVRSLARLYNVELLGLRENLETAVGRVGFRCETATSQ